MDIKNLKLTMDNLSNGGPVILQSVSPDYEYDADHKRTEKVIGLKVTVVFPGNGYNTQVVRVSDPTDRLSALLEKATPSAPIYISFEGFNASVYTMRGDDGRWRTGVSAKATGVRVVPGLHDDLDFGTEVD